MEQKPQTTFVVPKESHYVFEMLSSDGTWYQTFPVKLEPGKTYTISAHGPGGGGEPGCGGKAAGGGGGASVPGPTATLHTASVPPDTAPLEA